MKTTTRLLALLLALCMVFAFAACGKDPSDPTDPTDPSNPTPPTDPDNPNPDEPSKEEILQCWKAFSGVPQELELPSAPKQFLHYFEENDRPQAKLDRNLENGMAISIGRLREDTQYDYKFVCLSHNTLRGAAGGGVLLAELLAAKGYFD